MKTMGTLKKEAQAATAWRGHKMRWTMDTSFAFARCRRCGAVVWVELHPAPNSIGISGSAVATNCKRY